MRPYPTDNFIFVHVVGLKGDKQIDINRQTGVQIPDHIARMEVFHADAIPFMRTGILPLFGFFLKETAPVQVGMHFVAVETGLEFDGRLP